MNKNKFVIKTAHTEISLVFSHCYQAVDQVLSSLLYVKGISQTKPVVMSCVHTPVQTVFDFYIEQMFHCFRSGEIEQHQPLLANRLPARAEKNFASKVSHLAPYREPVPKRSPRHQTTLDSPRLYETTLG